MKIIRINNPPLESQEPKVKNPLSLKVYNLVKELLTRIWALISKGASHIFTIILLPCRAVEDITSIALEALGIKVKTKIDKLHTNIKRLSNTEKKYPINPWSHLDNREESELDEVIEDEYRQIFEDVKRNQEIIINHNPLDRDRLAESVFTELDAQKKNLPLDRCSAPFLDHSREVAVKHLQKFLLENLTNGSQLSKEELLRRLTLLHQGVYSNIIRALLLELGEEVFPLKAAVEALEMNTEKNTLEGSYTFGIVFAPSNEVIAEMQTKFTIHLSKDSPIFTCKWSLLRLLKQPVPEYRAVF